MRKIYFLSTLVLVLLAGNNVVAQEFSNKGKDFYLCFPSHVPSGTSLAQMFIFITSDKDSEGETSGSTGTHGSPGSWTRDTEPNGKELVRPGYLRSL